MFERLNTNPIWPIEYSYLQRRFHFRRRHYALLLPAYCFAVMSLFHPCRRPDEAIVGLMTIGIMGCFAMVTVLSIVVAAHSAAREWEPHERDYLVGLKIDAKTVVWGKWWAVMRHIWRWHVLVALAQVGLAVLMTEYLGLEHPPGLNVFHIFPLTAACFIPASTSDSWLIVNIQIQSVLLAGIALVIVSLAVAALAVALGLASPSYRVARHTAVTVLARFALAGVIWLMMLELSELRTQTMRNFPVWRSIEVLCYRERYWDECPQMLLELNAVRLVETVHSSVSMLLDGGTLMVVNILEPPYLSPRQAVRQFIAFEGGLFLYVILTWWALRRAQRAATWRYGLSPGKMKKKHPVPP